MADPAISAIAQHIFECSVGAAGENLGYIWNYKKNMASLKTQVNKLDEERSDKSHCVTVAEKNAQKIKIRVKSWQDEAEKISEEGRLIIKEYEDKGKNKCLLGVCPNLVSRYRLSKRACKKEIEMVTARKEGEQIKEVADPVVGKRTTISLSTKGLFTFDSRKSTLDDIMKTLQDDTKNIIGVYGLGGMGKTTLAKQVASHAAEEKMFEEIFMASVTNTVDMKEVQGQIASMLDLELKDSSITARAFRIHTRLNGKKVLVILDDIWQKLDLKTLGIPLGDNHMGCKILLTSRFSQVLSSMGTEKEFLLGALEEEEAWTLFEEKTIHVVKNSAFHDIGKKVAKRCAGLPVLVATVAASLSRRPDLDTWNDALTQLKSMNNKEMHEIVDSAIQSISYKYLKETHRRLFLLCGLIGRDVAIDDLLQYGLGWNMFDEDALTVEQIRNRLHTLILDLKDSCLLLDGYKKDMVKMHDVVKDVAISIARNDLNMFAAGNDDAELKKWPKYDVFNRFTAMVLRDCRYLPSLPEHLECPSLELFIICGSKLTVPDTLFKMTTKLKVLEMSAQGFSALPSSLSFMENVTALRLNGCNKLEDISIVGNMKKLQVLSLVSTQIKRLPNEMRQLCELRLLDLTNCAELKVIPAGLIADLSQLEELHMLGGFDNWEAEECSGSSVEVISSLNELGHLPNLSSLEITVPNAKFPLGNLNLEKLERYEIVTGDRLYQSCLKNLGEAVSRRKISLQLCPHSINDLRHGFKGLFKRTEWLCLRELNGIKNITPELEGDGFSELKHLCIQKDYDIQYMVNVEEKQHKAYFPALESLHLSDLLELRKVCNGRLMEMSFCCLTTIEINHCNRLESLFSCSLAKGLQCLQKIQVSNCNVLEEIVGKKGKEGDDASEKIEFAQLREISLQCLPKLISFFSDGNMLPIIKKRQKLMTTDVESQEIIEEEESRASLPFFEKVSLPRLEKLYLSGISNLTEIWSSKMSCANLSTEYPHEILPFQNLQAVTITECKGLKHVFPAYGAQSLIQLEQLFIGDSGVKTIIGDDNTKLEDIKAAEQVPTTFLLPKLVRLFLVKLPKLVCFYSEHTIVCPALDQLELSDCDKVSPLDIFSLSEKQGGHILYQLISKLKSLNIRSKDMVEILRQDVHFPSRVFHNLRCLEMRNFDDEYSPSIPILDKLEYLKVWECPHLTSLVLPSISFRFLSDLSVWNCGAMINLIPSSIARSLGNLMWLSIKGCEVVEEIIGGEEGDDESSQVDEIIFSNLKCLELEDLPRLTTFCSSSNYTFNFPSLSVLNVVQCPSMKTFCTGMTITPMLNAVGFTQSYEARWEGDLNSTIQWLFSEMIISKVENLTIRREDMMKMLRKYGHFPPQLFYNLKSLRCTDFDNESTASALKFLHEFHNQLERLSIYNCSFLEIFLYEGDQADEILYFPNLRHLELCKLPELRYVCKQKFSPLIPILDKIEYLYLRECPRLTRLVHAVSFKNLRQLGVWNCGGLINLIESSTARSLGQLQTLSVKGCKMIEEIIRSKVGEDEFEEDDAIIFIRLQRLELVDLPSLTNFCPSNYTFIFPSLEIVIVEHCPNMETFCGGITVTPYLRAVNLPEYENEERWEGDLNTTIEQFFAEMEVERLATTLSTTLSNIKFETDSETHEQCVDEFPVEPRKEGQICENGIADELANKAEICDNAVEARKRKRKISEICEEVVENCDKGKEKEIEVSDKAVEPQEIPSQSSKNSFHSYTAEEQTGVVSLASQYVVASALGLSLAISNSPDEEVQRRTTTLPSTPSNNVHHEAIEELTEPRKKGLICEESVSELGNKAEICENVNEPKEATEICEEVVEGGKEFDICVATKIVKVNDDCEKGKGKEFEVSGEALEHSEKLQEIRCHSDPSQHVASSSRLCLPTSYPPETSPPGTSNSIAPSNSQQKDFRGTGHAIPLLGEFLKFLHTQPVNSISEEHVQYMEDAIKWFCPYVDKARKCLERNKAIFELKLKIAEAEAQLQALEGENEATASSMPTLG